MDEEHRIILGIIRGDSRAFSLLVDRYEKLVFHVAKKVLPEQADAEDVAQEVFIKIHKNIGTFKFQSKLSTWIASITYFTAINHQKKNKRDFTEGYTEGSLEMDDGQENPQELMERKNAAHYLRQLTDQLPEKYRIVLTLFHLEEFSIEEIGETTGMPEGTIKNYLFRARRMLKDRIANHLNRDYDER